MTDADVDQLDHGLYILLWKAGGYSLASVGSNANGARWFAPTNWIVVPCFGWKDVAGVVPILTKIHGVAQTGIGHLVSVFMHASDIAKQWKDQDGINGGELDQLVAIFETFNEGEKEDGKQS